MDHPIIFSAPMIQALLAGRKVQTRRLAWREPSEDALEHARQALGGVPHVITGRASPWQRVKPGDRLWVREGWRVHKGYDHLAAGLTFTAMDGDVTHCVDYLATPRSEDFWGKGRPSIHMPRWASRLTLTVTEVRVERLGEISPEDAEAEGLWMAPDGAEDAGWWYAGETRQPRGVWGDGTVECFERLWNSLHGPDAWAANPEVVAVSFTVEQRNIDA